MDKVELSINNIGAGYLNSLSSIPSVIPAKAGIQKQAVSSKKHWIPASAGMTGVIKRGTSAIFNPNVTVSLEPKCLRRDDECG